MVRPGLVLVVATVLALPQLVTARVPTGSPSRGASAREATQGGAPSFEADTGARGARIRGFAPSNVPPSIVLAAHGAGFAARGGVRAVPRFGSASRSGHPAFRPFPFRRFPFRPFPFRPFVSFGFAAPLYVPYYWYNAYCDPASVYYYPPWCPYYPY